MESGSWILSWESSIEYYRIINERVRERLGDYHSARSITYSFDFDDIEGLQRDGNWEQANRLLTDAANRVHAAGAELLVICTKHHAPSGRGRAGRHRHHAGAHRDVVHRIIYDELVHASSDQSLAPCTWR